MNKDKDHACKLPSQNSIWTIHGIWPTKFHKMGPFNCNSSYEFDPQQIESIRKYLDLYWINIEAGKIFKKIN